MSGYKSIFTVEMRLALAPFEMIKVAKSTMNCAFTTKSVGL